MANQRTRPNDDAAQANAAEALEEEVKFEDQLENLEAIAAVSRDVSGAVSRAGSAPREPRTSATTADGWPQMFCTGQFITEWASECRVRTGGALCTGG